MNKEEKKAIKNLENFAYTIHGTFSVAEAKTILNLIEKLQKENEELKNECEISKTGSDYWCMKYSEFQSKNKEFIAKNNAIKKENEELHKEINERIKLKIENEKIVDTQFLPIQKVKDKLEELKRKINNGGKTYGRYGGCVINSENIMKLQNQIEALQELIEERK